MSKFRYKSSVPDLKEYEGEIEAESLEQASSQLRNAGISPSCLRSDAVPARPAPSEAFAVFNRALAGLVDLGLPLPASLRALSRSVGGEKMRRAIEDVAGLVEHGTPLDEALTARRDFFPTLYVQLVRAGLASGQLSTCLSAIARDVEERLAFRREVLSELFYPVIVLSVAAVIATMLTVVIVPIFSEYASLVVGGPAPVSFSSGFGWHIVLAAAAVAVLLVFLLWRSESFERVKLRVPILGRYFREVAAARFYMCLDTLLRSGGYDPSFLVASGSASGSSLLEREMIEASGKGREGQSVSEIIAGISFFPEGDADMLAFGEKTSSFPEMVSNLAQLHRESVRTLLGVLSMALPVAVTLLMGIVAAILIISAAHSWIEILKAVRVV